MGAICSQPLAEPRPEGEVTLPHLLSELLATTTNSRLHPSIGNAVRHRSRPLFGDHVRKLDHLPRFQSCILMGHTETSDADDLPPLRILKAHADFALRRTPSLAFWQPGRPQLALDQDTNFVDEWRARYLWLVPSYVGGAAHRPCLRRSTPRPFRFPFADHPSPGSGDRGNRKPIVKGNPSVECSYLNGCE